MENSDTLYIIVHFLNKVNSCVDDLQKNTLLMQKSPSLSCGQYTREANSKLLKFVKAPSLRSDKGSVFPPSHKAAAGQAAVTLQAATSNYPLQLFANGIFAIF